MSGYSSIVGHEFPVVKLGQGNFNGILIVAMIQLYFYRYGVIYKNKDQWPAALLPLLPSRLVWRLTNAGECRGDGGACIHEFVEKLCTKLDKCSGM